MPLFRPNQNSRSQQVLALFFGALACLTTLHMSAAESVAAESVIEEATDEAAVMMKKEVMMQKKEMMRKKAMMDASANTDISDGHACNPNGIALAGIDVVSYHNPTGPLMGNSDYTALHDGLTYRFISEAHLNMFVAAPKDYLPSYLGWCATSLAAGALTCPNPLNYKLEDGKLLLFETTGFTNGQDLWNADPLDYRRRADKNRDGFLSSAVGASELPAAPESAQL